LVGDAALIKRELPVVPENEALKNRIEELISEDFYALARSASDKTARKTRTDEIKSACMAKITEEFGEETVKEWAEAIERYFDKSKKHIIRDVVLTDNVRLDGRVPTDIRPIWCEVDYLPSAHGSSIFTRGETQSLTSLTLGTKDDQALIDTALDPHDDDFILHYNFPPYSTGEVKPLRGPGRREVGHANLAGRSLRKMLPQNFPYTVRVVSDILESNGSSSMATVCAGSMALMDGGVPLKAPVAGIAMGAIADDKGRISILSDILGDEDALGDMDFKVTGTDKGICGTQMDIKIDGMPYELLEKALLQARAGRIHILSKMADAIADPRPDLKPHAPRMIEFRIGRDYIGAVIGPGGKIIQEMQRQTGTNISISEDEQGGIVAIFGPDKEAIDSAYAKIMDIAFEPEVGQEYEGEVETLQPYGVFVKFRGKSGLLHVSEMSYSRIENVEEHFKVGDKVRFKIVEIDAKTGKLRLSRKATMPKPEGYVERPPRENGDDDRRGGGNDRRGGDDRRGGGDDRRGGGGGFKGRR
jgi:polyribonucleotide nucleotidyltransferase